MYYISVYGQVFTSPFILKCHMIVSSFLSLQGIFPSLRMSFEIVMLTPAQMDLCVLMKLDLERRRGMFSAVF